MEQNIRFSKIEGFDYTVDTAGNVRSIKRGNMIISQFSKQGSPPMVQLYDDNGHKRPYFVHRLMAQAFLDNPLRLNYVVHKNGDRQDNRLENIMWSAKKKSDAMIKGERWRAVPGMPRVKVSSKGRVKHDNYLLGTAQYSDGMKVVIPGVGLRTVELLRSVAFGVSDTVKVSRRVLTDQQVADIKRDYKKRVVTERMLGDKYGVTAPAIHAIISGKSWAHIEPSPALNGSFPRPKSPYEAVLLFKSGHRVIEVYGQDDCEGYLLYLHRKIRGIALKVDTDATEQGWHLIEKIN
jgi:hypothetical protein